MKQYSIKELDQKRKAIDKELQRLRAYKEIIHDILLITK